MDFIVVIFTAAFVLIFFDCFGHLILMLFFFSRLTIINFDNDDGSYVYRRDISFYLIEVIEKNLFCLFNKPRELLTKDFCCCLRFDGE